MTPFGVALRGKRVLVTGVTGFKGAWLAWWLHRLGAQVSGLALPPPTTPSLFEQLRLADVIEYREADLRDPASSRLVWSLDVDVVLHLAAQSLVRQSYEEPVATFATNVLGTAHVLDAFRAGRDRRVAVVVVTTDKCYENREWVYGYREDDALGGHDPYSASKACAELVTKSYQRSFFPAERIDAHGVAIASARAGNVIGPGDWARDRLVPDAMAALVEGRPIPVRNPSSVRPWQHVLEPLAGYLCLAARLLSAEAARYAEAWNFGPAQESERSVRQLVEELLVGWGGGRWEAIGDANARHEARMLKLSIEKVVARLGWRPVWGFSEAARRTARGYRALVDVSPAGARALLSEEIEAYVAAARGAGVEWAS
jgi:CDP-glucose 4,6-dehydratase